jgi:hypothetical protein
LSSDVSASLMYLSLLMSCTRYQSLLPLRGTLSSTTQTVAGMHRRLTLSRLTTPGSLEEGVPVQLALSTCHPDPCSFPLPTPSPSHLPAVSSGHCHEPRRNSSPRELCGEWQKPASSFLLYSLPISSVQVYPVVCRPCTGSSISSRISPGIVTLLRWRDSRR